MIDDAPDLARPDGIVLERSSHVSSLASEARLALAKGDIHRAWMVSDRLCRITGENAAIPLLLRGAALGAMGERSFARADADKAARIDPENPMVGEALLRAGDRDTRLRGARILLSSSDDRLRTNARSALHTEGLRALATAKLDGGNLHIDVDWLRGPAPRIGVTDGMRTWQIAIKQGDTGTRSPLFPRNGSGMLAWPEHVQALQVFGDEKTFIEPQIVRRLVPPGKPLKPSPGSAPGILVIVPVYGDAQATRLCLESLLAQRVDDRPLRIIAIDDASPDAEVRALVGQLAADRRVCLVSNPINLGFAGAVNRGLATRYEGEDVLFLNADTILPPGAVSRLRDAAHGDRRIGTVTPFSNNGEDTSFPDRFAASPMLDSESIARIDSLAAKVNRDSAIAMPNGVGFCLFVAARAMDAVGHFPLDFDRGYGEDIEFCLRVEEAGFVNVCATNVYVGHWGTRSFGGDKQALVRRNLSRIYERFPKYKAASDRFAAEDPLHAAAARIEALDLASRRNLRLALFPPGFQQAMGVSILSSLPGKEPGWIAVFRGADEAVKPRAPAGAPPRNLVFTPGNWIDWLAKLAAAGHVGDVLIVDPGETPDPAERVLLEHNVRTGYLLCGEGAARAKPSRLENAAQVFAACTHIKRIAENSGWASPISPLPDWSNAGPAPVNVHGRTLAVRALGDDNAGFDFLNAIARAVSAAAPENRIVILGRHARDLDLMRYPRVWVTGEMDETEMGPWLNLNGFGALLIAERTYGLTPPWAEAWAASGVPIACFGRSGTTPGKRFFLSPALSDEAAAEAVAAWFSNTVDAAGEPKAGLNGPTAERLFSG